VWRSQARESAGAKEQTVYSFGHLFLWRVYMNGLVSAYTGDKQTHTDRHISTPLSLSRMSILISARHFIRLNEFCLTLSASPLSLGGVPPTDALFTLETEIHNGKVMNLPLYHPRRQMRFQNRELKTLWGYVKVTVPYDQVLSPNSPVIKLGIQTLRNKEIMLHWFLTTH